MKKIIKFMIPVLSLTLLGSCGINKYRYEDHERYTTDSDFTLTDTINEIEVSWVNGNVNFVQGITTSVSVKEENYEDHPLYYLLDGTTLKIQFVEHGTKNSEFNDLEKDLTIVLPTTSADLEIDIVNGECNFGLLTHCNDANVSIVNGEVEMNSITADEIEIELVNGNVDINGISCTSLSIDKVNGNSTIEKISNAMKIEIDSVNGIDTITVPETLGYKVEHESIGTFTSDYDNAKSYGDQKVKIEYSGANASLIIKK